jgi:hypothetical protein
MQSAFKLGNTGYRSDQFVNLTQNFDLVQQPFSKVMPGVTTTLTSVTGSDHQAQSDIPVKLGFYLFRDRSAFVLSLLVDITSLYFALDR